MKKIERKLQEISKSLLLTLPAEWARQFKLKKGSTVEVAVADDGFLRIAPVLKEKHVVKRALIDYDSALLRRFFREYLAGNEFITIRNVKSADKKALLDFIQNNLMNVEIVEETKDKIVVQNFKLENITINSCFKRMYFIVKGMYDDLLAGDKSDIKDKDKSVAKFYYMLVRLVRQSMEQSRFLMEQELEPIEIVDYRLAAEKIERIGDLLKDLSDLKYAKDVENYGKDVKKYVDEAVLAFLSKDFDKAVQLWKSKSAMNKKYFALKKKKKDKQDMEALYCFYLIFLHASSLASLVRGKL